MKTASFITGLVFICCKFTERTTAEGQLEGFVETLVQSECRDRYLWIQVASVQTPRFEAVDGNGVHSISEQLASHCGYTISTFKMDGFTTFRASYYSCFTHNQDDEVFTFRFNVIVSNGGDEWISRPVSAACSGLIWTHREIICEEDYMEVNVNRASSCGGQWGQSGQAWQTAFSQAQKMASSVWQLMFLQDDGQVSSMSINEAQAQGYSLTTSAKRVVLRSRYKQPHAKIIMVDGIPVEVVRVSLFFKRQLMVMMIDMSMACTVSTFSSRYTGRWFLSERYTVPMKFLDPTSDSGSFDGERLLWDIPLVMTPLVQEHARFESRSLSMGVEGVLLDESTATARGFSLVQRARLVQIRVLFGAEGGYRKSLVVNNTYRELYVVFLLYEHIFSLLYEDGSSIDTRHRMLRVLDTPLLCHPPFSLDQTISDDQVFSIYLGNIPTDVILEEVRINRKHLMMADAIERGVSISPVIHINGSRAYELRLPFQDAAVHWTYLGGGVVQYSIDINFTLTILPQRDSYYHQTFLTAQVFNAFPPEITAQCSDRGIAFSVVRLPRAESLWEVGIDHEPLTSQLVAERGYRLHNDTLKTTLEIPMFSIGYTYEGINLSNFYGTFKLLLRDSKTLEVQTSTSKRCLFRTQDMTVCSADGIVAVVVTLTSTWPTVQPETTSLLDPTCRPKQTDGSRVLFEFKVDSCGTRLMVGESYMVYENEILHDRLITDGPNFISRESQFKLTVRCFYPLSGVSRLSVDRIFRSEIPGFGSVKVFESLKDSANEVPAQDCSRHLSGNAIKTPTNHVQQTPTAGGVLPHPAIRPLPKPGPSHFITVPGEYNKLVSSQDFLTLQIPNLSPEPQTVGIHRVHQQVSSHPGHAKSQTKDQTLFSPLSSISPRYGQIPGSSIQLSNLNTPNFDSVDVRGEQPGLADDTSVLDSSSNTPDSPVAEQQESIGGSPGQTGLKSLGDHVWHSGLMVDQYHPVLQPPAQYIPEHISIASGKLLLPSRHKKYVPADTKHKHTIPGSPGETQESVSDEPTSIAASQVYQNLERTGSIEKRNTETVQLGVKNIRVKPLSKFVPSGHNLNHKPAVKQANSQISNPSQYGTGLTSISNDWNHWTSQQLQDPRGSNTRQELPVKTGKQTQGVHGVRVKLHESGAIHLADLSPDQQGHQQGLIQSVAETGNTGGQESASALRNVLQPTATSHIRVRLVQGFSGGIQTNDQSRLQNLQNSDSVTRGGISRPSNLSFTLQKISKTPVNTRAYKPTEPNTHSNEGLNPTAGGAGFTGSHTTPKGSGSLGYELKSLTRSNCGSQYGSSVHQGIRRGKQIS
ncbi:uncharacterized protein LOC121199464 isoform X2 [Toxotes jaculatrix]|uniref:uncharacterized protein LOC121199464 isoform X2 n=1 Tax=Toxotes jaculatrix TaxID=941984 RepID=UPI001B3AB2A6|nr:uncharacterized protein LOC121199464 isoform X2 [Toxotes jaculatrix]